VEGYEGSAETKERMFERDKDDLRSLGIEIEVGSFDPLFNDDAGYRIRSEKYQLDLGEITPIEISLLSMAANAWQGAALDDAAQRAILKLNSMGIDADSLDLPAIAPKLSNSSEEIAELTRAIAASDILNFSYLGSDLSQELRTVVPFSLVAHAGNWYLSGVDQSIQEVRTFRIDRILGPITSTKNPGSFEMPEGFNTTNIFDNHDNPRLAIIDVRKGKCQSLRALATSTKDLGEWDQIRVPILNESSLSAQILWHLDDAFVLEPDSLRDLIKDKLSDVVKLHG
jgi:proteasome accessory factor B